MEENPDCWQADEAHSELKEKSKIKWSDTFWNFHMLINRNIYFSVWLNPHGISPTPLNISSLAHYLEVAGRGTRERKKRKENLCDCL